MPSQPAEIGVGEPGALEIAQQIVRQVARADGRGLTRELDNLLELGQEPADRCA